MDDDCKIKNRNNKTIKNVASSFTKRAEDSKLFLRKSQIEEFIMTKRLKLEEESNNEFNQMIAAETNNTDNLVDYHLIKEVPFNEAADILKNIFGEENNMNNLYPNLETIKNCVINIRKSTCRQIQKRIKHIIESKVHSILMSILVYYQNEDIISEIEDQIIVEALWALSNMVGFSNTSIFPDIKDNGFLSVLKNYLYKPSDKSVDHTILCLGNIIAESQEFRDFALKIGVLEKVVQISKDSNKPIEMTRNCMFLISNILRGKPQPQFNLIAPSLQMVANSLWSDDEEIVKTCLWSISYLSDGYENIQHLIIQTGCIPKILEYVCSPKKDLYVPCLRTIGNLTAGSKQAGEKLIENNCLNILIELFLNSIGESIKRDILWCFLNFSECNVNVINAMIDNEEFNLRLITASQNSTSPKLRYSILSLYYNIVCKGNSYSIQKLVEFGIIPVLVGQLKTTINQVRLICLGMLYKIIRPDSQERDTAFDQKLWAIFCQNDLENILEQMRINLMGDSLLFLVNKLLEAYNKLNPNPNELTITK